MLISKVSILEDIRAKIGIRQYELSRHAVDQSILRNISISEIEAAILGQSEIIEDYPDDKYGPSCLILGFASTGRPLHLQCSYATRDVVKVITMYEPNPDLWANYRERKTD